MGLRVHFVFYHLTICFLGEQHDVPEGDDNAPLAAASSNTQQLLMDVDEPGANDPAPATTMGHIGHSDQASSRKNTATRGDEPQSSSRLREQAKMGKLKVFGGNRHSVTETETQDKW